MDNTITNRAADNIRILSAAMVEKAKSGHPGGAMGGADFINILYSEFLNYDPDKLDYPFRDRSPRWLWTCSMSLICASCSMGWCVGPSSPTRNESCVQI